MECKPATVESSGLHSNAHTLWFSINSMHLLWLFFVKHAHFQSWSHSQQKLLMVWPVLYYLDLKSDNEGQKPGNAYRRGQHSAAATHTGCHTPHWRTSKLQSSQCLWCLKLNNLQTTHSNRNANLIVKIPESNCEDGMVIFISFLLLSATSTGNNHSSVQTKTNSTLHLTLNKQSTSISLG